MSKGGYIRTGFSNELDALRKLSNDVSSWMIDMQIKEQEKISWKKL